MTSAIKPMRSPVRGDAEDETAVVAPDRRHRRRLEIAVEALVMIQPPERRAGDEEIFATLPRKGGQLAEGVVAVRRVVAGELAVAPSGKVPRPAAGKL